MALILAATEAAAAVRKKEENFPTKSKKVCKESIPPGHRRKLNVQKTFRKHPGRKLNVLCTFNLCLCPGGNLYNVDATRSG